MDLAITQSIIKSPSHSNHHHHHNLNRTNSQQIISTTYNNNNNSNTNNFIKNLNNHETNSLTKFPLEQINNNNYDDDDNNTNIKIKFSLKTQDSQSTQQQQQQQQKLGSNRKYYFGASKTIMNLLPKNDDDINNNNEYDANKIKEQIKTLINDINEHLILSLNGYITEYKKSNQVLISVCLVFLKIGEIDTVKERFQADAYIESSWEDETIDPKIPFDPRNHWNPELHIENAIGELKQEIRYKIQKVNGKYKVFEMRNIKGVFWERLELWDFPLDVQELSITLSTTRSQKEISFEENPDHPCTVNTQDFLNQQEWNIFTHVNTTKKTVTDLWNKCKRPCFSTTAFVSRKPGYFIYNAYMLIFFVSTLGFVPFSFTVANNHFRIQVTSLLILTSVNFRWIVTQRLPTVSYLTTLDKYAIGALIFLVALCGWHATIGSSVIYDNDKDNKDRVDMIVLIVIGVFYIIYHIVYFTLFYFKYRKYESIGKQAKYEEYHSNNLTAANTPSINSINVSSVHIPVSNSLSNVLKRKKSKTNQNQNSPSISQNEESNKNMKNFNYNSNMKTIVETTSSMEMGNSSIVEHSSIK